MDDESREVLRIYRQSSQGQNVIWEEFGLPLLSVAFRRSKIDRKRNLSPL